MVVAVGTAILLALGTGVSPAAGAGFLVGTGAYDTTPPLAGTADARAANAQFGSAYASCASLGTQGRFALQEPFADTNGNGQWDPGFSLSGAPTGVPEPFCDANGNGRWDGIIQDNNYGPATGVNDPANDRLNVRAVAIADGVHRPVVYASVTQIGIFDYYTDEVRSLLKSTYGVDADLVVSANHNESSPDSIGIFGAGTTPLGVGVRSGIDEYFMSWLDDRIAHAAADAVHRLAPAELYANQIEAPVPDGLQGSTYPLLTGLSQRISDQFPTAVKLPGDDRIAAVDPKVGVLQARTPAGTPIATVVSQAAHNQEMGNASAQLSSDWPGALQRDLDAAGQGMGLYLVGENGSEEDPTTSPTTHGGSEVHKLPDQYLQALDTGQREADNVRAAAADAARLDPGPVTLTRRQICVPLENNGFLALAAAGEFGKRQGWACDRSGNPVAPIPNGLVAPTASTQFRTFVAYASIGPDLQLIDNPGEAFPALMVGSPFGDNEESCPRPNPAVPTWHARAPYRFQVGLADDLIGYMIPAWGFASGTPGLFNNDNCSSDQNGHGHKLESESVGPTSANDVADSLAGMLDAQPDPSAHVVQGRFVLANGAYSRWPTLADGVLIPTPGQTRLDPGSGVLIGSPLTAGFGGRAVDANGFFMDYDGQPQARPDVTTRGIMVLRPDGCVAARFYLNVFPSMNESSPLGAASAQPFTSPGPACPSLSIGGVGEIQPGAAERAGLAVPFGTHAITGTGGVVRYGCRAGPPTSAVARRAVRVRGGRLSLSGRARAYPCGRAAGRVAHVTVTIVHRDPRHPHSCRYVDPRGRLTPPRSCSGPGIQLLARGRERWSLTLRLHVPRGRYTAIVRATDAHALVQPGGARADLARVTVA